MITFATAVSRGRKAVTAQGKANWLLGDIALTVKPEYGDDTVGKLADEIGVAPATLANLRTIAAAYEPNERETGNSHTVYGIFASQDDRGDLVTEKIWTVREARAEISARNGTLAGDGDGDGDGDGAGDSEDNLPDDIDSKVARAAAEVMRLQGELAKATAALAKLELERDASRKPARTARTAGTPAVKTAPHIVRGIPTHDAGQVRADCPRCRENVAKAKAARTAAAPAKAGKAGSVKAPGGRRERVAA